MTQHMHRDLEQIKRDVLTMGGLVEESLQAGRAALLDRKLQCLEVVEPLEQRIDSMQMAIDDEILKLLALHQPVAGDLRFVTAAMKIVNDLERIGDLACTVAKRLREVLQMRHLEEPLHLEKMMDCAVRMVSSALNAFVELDTSAAHAVLELDDEVDSYHRDHFVVLIERMQRDPSSVKAGVGLLSVSRSVERIADLATNIAEDVIFISTGEDVRHPGLQLRG